MKCQCGRIQRLSFPLADPHDGALSEQTEAEAADQGQEVFVLDDLEQAEGQAWRQGQGDGEPEAGHLLLAEVVLRLHIKARHVRGFH